MVGDFTAMQNGESHVATTKVGGLASITGGSYEGGAFTGQQDAVFNNVHTLTMDKSLAAQNITITDNGTANVASAEATTGAFSASGGSWKGTSLTSGGASSFTDLNDVNIDDANIGTSLAMTSSAGAFTNLKTGSGITVDKGSITATTLQTGDEEKKDCGDVTVTGANFSFGVGAAGQAQIHGKLTATSLGNGASGDLKIDGTLDVSGGALTGQKLEAADATLKDNSLKVADSLKVNGAFKATAM